MAFVGYASIFCIMGVWGGVYLHEVHGLDLVERGYALLAMAIAFALGLFFFGWLARRLGSMKRAVVVGAVLAIAPFAVLAAWTRPPAPAATPRLPEIEDRKNVVRGKSGSVRVSVGGLRI